jgi:hypothetical protein
MKVVACITGAIAVAALALAACAQQEKVAKAPEPLQAEAASGGIELFATLAVGEFDAATAPVYTKLAKQVHDAAVARRNGTVSTEDAEAVAERVKSQKAKLIQAEALCKPDHKGKCTGDGKAAYALVSEVASAL